MKKLFMEREMSAGEKVYVRIRSYSEAEYGFYIDKVGWKEAYEKTYENIEENGVLRSLLSSIALLNDVDKPIQ